MRLWLAGIGMALCVVSVAWPLDTSNLSERFARRVGMAGLALLLLAMWWEV